MWALIRANQLNIMLALSAVCGTSALFVLIANALPKRRRLSLLLLELSSMFLLYFDRLAYMYSGDRSRSGYVLVRVTNFLVFSLTLVVILAFNIYLKDYLMNEGGLTSVPRRLLCVNILSFLGILLIVISQFTHWYYYFDETNSYNRGPLFLLCYVFPLITPIIQLSVILQYRKRMDKKILLSLILFIVVPMVASVGQVFAYGLSLTNIAVVGMAVLVYIFALFDINERLNKANKREIDFLKEERESMQRLFEQTASTFVGAIDAKDPYTQGHSPRVAEYARKIARAVGKSEKDCDEIYYSALLHEVGKLCMPDDILKKKGELTEEETEILRQEPLIGDELLSKITEYPFLRVGARYAHEKYDGSGYPEGLKGDQIPEVARIIAVADYYDTITSQRSDRDAYPQAMAREEFLKGEGTLFDPRFANVMITLMDADSGYEMKGYSDAGRDDNRTDLDCEAYRTTVGKGILVDHTVTKIRFKCTPKSDSKTGYSMPSVIVFDSFDGRVHTDEKIIKVFHYMEYGEIWFDGHIICTDARDMEASVSEKEDAAAPEALPAEQIYEITTGRFDDHAKITLEASGVTTEVIVALPDASKYIYVGLTGEYCTIKDIEIENTDTEVKGDDIPRIAPRLSYINRLESDIPNVQIDGSRAAYTRPIPIKDGSRIIFHSMSLPSSTLVWHCPYVVLYTSDDGEVGGENYREYALIKTNGETDEIKEHATNRIEVTRDASFTGWEGWKAKNRDGIECEVDFSVKNGTVVTELENSGIIIKNTTMIKEPREQIYAALTGDICALTDIRVL